MQQRLQKIRVKIKQNDSPAHFIVEYENGADKPEFGVAQNHSLDWNSNKNESGPKRNTGKYYLLFHISIDDILSRKIVL